MPLTCTHPSQPFLPCYFWLAFLLSSFLCLFSSCLCSAVTCVLTQVTFHLTPNLHLLRGLQRLISVMRRKGRREGTMCICVAPLHCTYSPTSGLLSLSQGTSLSPPLHPTPAPRPGQLSPRSFTWVLMMEFGGQTKSGLPSKCRLLPLQDMRCTIYCRYTNFTKAGIHNENYFFSQFPYSFA